MSYLHHTRDVTLNCHISLDVCVWAESEIQYPSRLQTLCWETEPATHQIYSKWEHTHAFLQLLQPPHRLCVPGIRERCVWRWEKQGGLELHQWSELVNVRCIYCVAVWYINEGRVQGVLLKRLCSHRSNVFSSSFSPPNDFSLWIPLRSCQLSVCWSTTLMSVWVYSFSAACGASALCWIPRWKPLLNCHYLMKAVQRGNIFITTLWCFSAPRSW